MQSYQIEFHEDIAKRSVILPTQQWAPIIRNTLIAI
jgi:hypothetical protein